MRVVAAALVTACALTAHAEPFAPCLHANRPVDHCQQRP